MNRRQFLQTTTLASLGLSTARLTSAQQTTAPVTDRPNLLFFYIDDQRNTTLGCAGDPIVRTPNIDALAARGILFRNAFVTTSICAASRACVLTGVTERTHGYTFGKEPVPERFTRAAYPALLREAGYRTGFFGKFGAKYEGLENITLFDESEKRDRPYLRKQKDGSVKHIDEMNIEGAIRFLKSQPQGQPFNLSVSFSSGHAEDNDKENHYPPIDAVKDMYADVTFPEPRLNDPAIFENQPEFLRESMNRKRYFWRWDTSEKYQKNMRNYYRLISGIDVMIGRVQKVLEEQGFADNTVIIYAADNGYYMGDRGFAGKWSHYEESLRVPMIIYDPRVQKKSVVNEMALNIDITATLLDMAGVNVPAHYQGRSLAPFVRGEKPDGWRTDFFCEHRMEHEDIPKWEGVREERYIYARYDEQQPAYEFLHDLKIDPDELKNFVNDPQYNKELIRLRKRCDVLRDRYIKAREK